MAHHFVAGDIRTGLEVCFGAVADGAIGFIELCSKLAFAFIDVAGSAIACEYALDAHLVAFMRRLRFENFARDPERLLRAVDGIRDYGDRLDDGPFCLVMRIEGDIDVGRLARAELLIAYYSRRTAAGGVGAEDLERIGPDVLRLEGRLGGSVLLDLPELVRFLVKLDLRTFLDGIGRHEKSCR